jgi:hypothetical protein
MNSGWGLCAYPTTQPNPTSTKARKAPFLTDIAASFYLQQSPPIVAPFKSISYKKVNDSIARLPASTLRSLTKELHWTRAS